MIKFKLRELIAEKEQLEGIKITYRDIQEATGINLNTLTAMAKNDMKQVHLATIERLCNYFNCPIENFMLLDVINPQQKFRMQLYEKIGRHIDQQRILPQKWSLPPSQDYIQVEVTDLPRNEVWALFYISKNGSLSVGLSVKTKDKQKNQDIFAQLKARKDEIESIFGKPMTLESPAFIRHELSLQYPSRQERWPEIQEEMIATWEHMINAFTPPLQQIWISYKSVIKSEFSFERDHVKFDQAEPPINIDKKIKEYTTVINCDRCVRQADHVILRNDDNIPQPGYIGSRYEQHGVLFIPQNPGYAKPQRTIQHQKYAEAEKAFLNNPTQDNMEKLQALLVQAMPHWTIYAQILSPLLTGCNLTLADIAFFNIVRCPTISNSTPSATMVANCKFHLEHWLEWLKPKVVVCIGKWAYREVEPILTRHNIPYAYINRDRSLSEVERMKNMEEVGQLVRVIVSAEKETGGPDLDSRPLQQQTGSGQTAEIPTSVSAEEPQAGEDTEIELTSEEQAALAKINSEKLKTIYLELIDFSKKLKNVDARQIQSGSKLSFRYVDVSGKYAFSFIVNQYHLLFYIRGLALRNLPSLEEDLKRNNIPFTYNPSGEMQIRIVDEGLVAFLKKLLADYYAR